MANSFGGVSLTTIADKGLANLKRRIGPISRYSTDFSNEFMAPGQSAITTHLFSAGASARTFATTDTSYTRDDTTTTAVTVTPDILYLKNDINELVLSGSPLSLEARIAEVGAEAVAKGVFDRLNALVTAANFTTSVTAVALANFGFDDIVDAQAALVAAGISGDMHTCISAAAYGNLLKSTSTYPQIQRDANGTGNILAGFPGIGDVYPISSVAANSENLYGWTAAPDAFCIVARQPMVPHGFAGEVVTATDPESGLSFQVRMSFNDGLYTIWTGALVGVAKGRATALYRYITA